MTSHLGLLVLFAACVAAVFAALHRDDQASAVRLGLRLFGAMALGAVALGWLLYFVFG